MRVTVTCMALSNALAISLAAAADTGNKRSALLPDMVTLAESGVRGFDINPWFGVVGPARLTGAGRRVCLT